MPSRTAYATAFARALHVVLDDRPPVLDDQTAIELLPAYQRRYLRLQATLPVTRWRRRMRVANPAMTSMRSQIVVRARYAEDSLAEARQTGVTRYVILGAGLDTFALRQPAPPIDVVEIDHPATQRWKQQLLQRRGLEVPPTLTFLPVDFERSALTELWIDNAAADFISWLGTTYYLSREGISSTLEAVAACTRPGSQLVLDYWRKPSQNIDAPLLMGTRFAVALQGEPMRSFFEPPEIAALAEQAGWRIRENCTAEQQNLQYLKHRQDRLAVPSFACVLKLER